jgi:hypothetical protein
VTAFAATTDVLFADPHLARDAVYRPAGAGDGIPVRVMLRRPDRIESFGETRLASSTTMLDLRVSEIAVPVAGDTLEVDGRTVVVQGTPLLDAEGLVWSLDTRPA